MKLDNLILSNKPDVFKSEFMRYIQTFVHDKSLNLIQIKQGILRCEAFFKTELM